MTMDNSKIEHLLKDATKAQQDTAKMLVSVLGEPSSVNYVKWPAGAVIDNGPPSTISYGISFRKCDWLARTLRATSPRTPEDVINIILEDKYAYHTLGDESFVLERDREAGIVFISELPCAWYSKLYQEGVDAFYSYKEDPQILSNWLRAMGISEFKYYDRASGLSIKLKT